MDGMSPPSNRTGFRRDTTTTAHRPGSRQSNGSNETAGLVATRPPLSRARMPAGRGGGVAFLVDVELLDHARGNSRHIVADREGNPLVAGREEQLDVVAEVAGEDPLEVGFGDA